MAAVETVPDILQAAAEERGTDVVFHLEEGVVRLRPSDLLEGARAGALQLAARGIGPRDAVGLLGPNRPEWMVWAWAIWQAGAVVVPLPLAGRVHDPAAFVEQIHALVGAAGCRLVLADPRLLFTVPDDLAASWDLPTATGGRPPRPPRPGDRAVIQFTSGSTASPKGVVLSHRAVIAAMEAARAHSRADLRHAGAERFVGWLPFFHDYGLFGYVVRPVYRRCEAHLLPTERFVEDPVAWFRLLGEVGGTLTSAPSSAWGIASRLAAARPEGVDLSSAQFYDAAAETIDPAVVDRVLEVGGRFGLDPRAFVGGYGMAEVTMGISAGRYLGGLRIDQVDLDRLADARVAEPATAGRVKRVASCGVPLGDNEIRVADEGDRPVPQRVVGEVHVRAASVMDGYLAVEGIPDPFTTDGWLRTGDLGYLADGELFITGRRKDVIIVMGRNYAPDDIEWAAARLPEVRTGRCVAFGPPGGGEGEVVVVVEPAGESDPAALPSRVREAVFDAVGITPRGVVVVPRGSVPKTTSGKLRRAAVREAYQRGELQREALAVSDSAGGGGRLAGSPAPVR